MKKLTTRTFVPAKSLTYVVTWLLIAMVIAVAGCLLFFLNSLDRIAADELAQRISLARNLETKHGQDILEEYTYWDDAYIKVAIEHDTDWVEGNSGYYLMNKGDFDFSVGIIEGEQEAYLVKSTDSQALRFTEIQKPLFNLMTLSDKLETESRLVNGFFLLGSDIYHIMGGPFIDEELITPRKGTFLAVGKRVDPDYLSKLESRYQLFGLRVTPSPENMKNFIAIKSPLGDTIGYLSWNPRALSRDIIPAIIIITILFSFIITAVMKIILNKEQTSREEYEEKLFIEATTDSLTEVNNRRYFMEVGARELKIYQHLEDRQFTILVLDIDHFKAVNDQHGHSVGDKALTHFVQLCLLEIRDSDIFGRLGGEEFAIALPNTNLDKAIEVANRIRISVAETPFISKDKPIYLTVSIGAALLGKQDQLEVLIDKADKALYAAKHEGRNRVIIFN
ncbi:sensor domain-containing diguanylate cyclase [Aliivibrio kagoshimensis]|uniref:sensor domain-containing diguanylate cyclase n=1 Tax=Aliivibrio kagoshimensis TaxID=2910230 RepID=UPI003D121341